LTMFLILRRGQKVVTKGVKFDVKNEKMLLIKLLPYKDEDPEVAKLVELLEANIYSTTKEKIDKKLLKEIVKKYNIS